MTARPTRPATAHESLQQQVTDLLKMTGWRWLHVRRSIGKGRKWVTTTNVKGWPDLAPVWSPRQPGRVLAIELKAATGMTVEQTEVMADLEAAGFECYVVTSKDLDSLAKTLTRSAPARG